MEEGNGSKKRKREGRGGTACRYGPAAVLDLLSRTL